MHSTYTSFGDYDFLGLGLGLSTEYRTRYQTRDSDQDLDLDRKVDLVLDPDKVRVEKSVFSIKD